MSFITIFLIFAILLSILATFIQIAIEKSTNDTFGKTLLNFFLTICFPTIVIMRYIGDITTGLDSALFILYAFILVITNAVIIFGIIPFIFRKKRRKQDESSL